LGLDIFNWKGWGRGAYRLFGARLIYVGEIGLAFIWWLVVEDGMFLMLELQNGCKKLLSRAEAELPSRLSTSTPYPEGFLDL